MLSITRSSHFFGRCAGHVVSLCACYFAAAVFVNRVCTAAPVQRIPGFSIRRADSHLWVTSRACATPQEVSSTFFVAQVAMHFLNFEARHLFGSLSQLQLGVVDRFFDLPADDAKKVRPLLH